jgi:hypothetical protein
MQTVSTHRKARRIRVSEMQRPDQPLSSRIIRPEVELKQEAEQMFRAVQEYMDR